MKTKIMKGFLTGLMTLFLFSCGENSSDNGPKLKDTGDLGILKKQLLSHYGNDQEIYQLSLSASSELSSSFGYATAYFIKDGKDYTQTLKIIEDAYILDSPAMAEKSFQTEFFLKKKQGKKKINELNFNDITEHFDSAEKILSERYENVQLNNYDFNLNNAHMLTAEFTVHATKKGESPTQQGNMEVTDFYEFNFEVNNAGELMIAE